MNIAPVADASRTPPDRCCPTDRTCYYGIVGLPVPKYDSIGETKLVPKDSLPDMERGFDALVSQLRRQLAALEREFMKALRNLGKAYRAAQSSDAAAPAQQAPRGVPRHLDGIIRGAAERHEVDPNLVRAVIGRESGFRTRAVSRAGAVGLMQLMPDTAEALGVSDAFDPAQNVEAGTRLLRRLIDRYGGRLDLALAAYNAGPAAVDACGDVPPYAETQAYVRDVLATYKASALAS